MKRWKARAGAHLRGRAESESCCTPGGRPTVTVWAETIARRLRAFHLDSIRNQMLVFAVVATILPALALTVASSSRQDRRSIVDQIAQELRGTSAEAAWEIDQWLSDRLRDLRVAATAYAVAENLVRAQANAEAVGRLRSEEHTSELQSRPHLVCRLLLEKKKQKRIFCRRLFTIRVSDANLTEFVACAYGN